MKQADAVKVEWRRLRHDCIPPEVDLYAPGLFLRWKCPECGQRWLYNWDESSRWRDYGSTSWRWRKRQGRLVSAALSGSTTPFSGDEQ